MNSSSFSSLALNAEMLNNLEKLGYHSMTPIQAAALPHILDGRDVIAKAKTGSGKTAAFGIGTLARLEQKFFGVQSLVLCPTRELAEQVASELRRLARFRANIKILTLCGGVAFGPQLGSLAHGAHIVVGTPGRVLKHLKKDSLKLDALKSVVLDEADKMLEMGFSDEMDEVLSFVPHAVQTLLFSATISEEVEEISKSIQQDAISVETTQEELKNEIQEEFYATSESSRDESVVDILSLHRPKNAMIFTNTKAKADELSAWLRRNGIDALALHGDLEQYDRVDVLVQFTNASVMVLVATDVAARGIDIKELPLVINYELPHNQETYIHRIGRTGRAGASGVACTIYTEHEMQKAEEYRGDSRVFKEARSLKRATGFEMIPPNVTLVIEGGKKDKLRAGDILGSLCVGAGIAKEDIGAINIYDKQSYVAIAREKNQIAFDWLKNGKIKGKNFSIWRLV